MNYASDHLKESSAPSAIALLWLMLRQVIALAFSGAAASASELLDKLERDLNTHILAEARKLAALEEKYGRRDDNSDDNDNHDASDDPVYRIACIKGRFVQIPVTEAETRDPKIRRAAILGQVQFMRFIRAARLARRVVGAGQAFATRRLKAFLRSIIDTGCAFAAPASDTQQHTDARIRAPP